MIGTYYDNLAAERAMQFVRLLTLTKCTQSGQPEPFEPMGWFARLIGNIYGWRKSDQTRLYKRVLVMMARKNGKTQSIAALALAELFGIDQAEAQPEVYMAAKSVEQASYCFSAARDMVRADNDLSSICRITDSTKTIQNSMNGGVLKVLSAEGKSKHGSNPSCVIFDELHAWGGPEQELYDALTSGSVARRQPLFLMISTAGSNIESICGREYQFAKKIISGIAQDPTYYPLIYELPNDADWTDEKNWALANPGLGITIKIEALRDEVNLALARPAEQNRVRRLHFNQWTETSEVWIPPIEWDECKAESWPDLSGMPCYAGLDLSMTRDLSALACVWIVDERIYCKTHYWIPGSDITERSKRDGVRYDDWIYQGYIEATPGEVVDYTYITRRIIEIAEQYGIKQLAYDRWGAEGIRQALEADGINVCQFGQGFRSMSAPSKELENRVFGRKIYHDGNPVMRWNFSCCSKNEDAAQAIKPAKTKGAQSSQRIDGVVALVMALGVSSQEPAHVPVGVIAI